MPSGGSLKTVVDSDLSKINDGSCFQDYWDLYNSLLTPLISNLRDNQEPDFKALSELAEKLDGKIEDFYNKNKTISENK